MSFKNAITKATSNKTGDTGTPRLSGWLQYSSTYPTLVPITANYAPQNGFAYKIEVRSADGSANPSKLIITSTGYGPKGATKILEMAVQAGSFDFSAPATVTLRGSDSGSGLTRCGSGAQNKYCFGLGNAARKIYSGVDYANAGTVLPAFATTNADTSIATAALNGGVTATNPTLGKLMIDTSLNPGATAANASPSPALNPVPPNASTPPFLQTADNARAFLNQLQALATATLDPSTASGTRYFTSFNGAAGSTSAPTITFVDGNATVTGGAGILVVTGDLLLHENYAFNGLILVLGGGYMQRQGGGPSTLHGAVVVARFARTWPASENGQAHPFLNAGYDTQADQGNDVLMQYDSDSIREAMELTGLRVIHVAEK
jgi:hypothetical protein